jgi:hypothetical protein
MAKPGIKIILATAILLFPGYLFADNNEDQDKAGFQAMAISEEEKLRVKEIFGQDPVSKEQRCWADFNCCTVKYFAKDAKLIGSSEGCMNNNPAEPYKYNPSIEYFDSDGRILGEIASQEKE